MLFSQFPFLKKQRWWAAIWFPFRFWKFLCKIILDKTKESEMRDFKSYFSVDLLERSPINLSDKISTNLSYWSDMLQTRNCTLNLFINILIRFTCMIHVIWVWGGGHNLRRGTWGVFGRTPTKERKIISILLSTVMLCTVMSCPVLIEIIYFVSENYKILMAEKLLSTPN